MRRAKIFLTLLATRYPGCYIPTTLIFEPNYGPGCSVPCTERSTESTANIVDPRVLHLASGFGHPRRLGCWDRPATPRCENRQCSFIILVTDAFLIAKLLFPPPVMSATPGVPNHNHDLMDCPYIHRKLHNSILSEQALSLAGTDQIQCPALEDAAIQMRGL